MTYRRRVAKLKDVELGAHAPASRLVGRVAEQQQLRTALAGAAAGEPCAVVVTGEAGVGKTRLVREVLRDVDAEVLWGSCVRFGASSLPFAPVAGALRSWLLQAHAPLREEVLAGSADLQRLLPGFVGAEEPPGRVIPLLDAALHRIAERRLAVLVVDDIHWADPSSLDALAYVIAGFHDQRVAVVATCREEHRPAGHPLHAWLADMRRMPSFSEIGLWRLDLAETETLVSELLGRRVDVDLAVQVQQKSGGNPYLTELLLRGLDGDVRELPASAPTELRDALAARWHALGPQARSVVRVLAVGGRPQRFDVLGKVAQSQGLTRAAVSQALAEAADEGVVREERGRFWFRHPLLAEVLYDGMPPGEPARLHAAYARALEGLPADRDARAADLAVHHERAGNAARAFEWSLRAAEQAVRLHASVEEAAHLERACRLWPSGASADLATDVGRVGLLFSAARVCSRVSRYDDAIRLLDQARALVDPRKDPLLAGKLLTAWCGVVWQRWAPGTSRLPEHDEVLRLTEAFPDSVERVEALATVAGAQGWDGDYASARRNADLALQAARRNGSARALALALNTWASLQPSPDGAVVDALDQALRLARATGDLDQFVDGVIWRTYALSRQHRLEDAVETSTRGFADVLAIGDTHWAYFISSAAAWHLLALGRWTQARDLVREGLAARCAGIPGGLTRLVAAQLAVRTGDPVAARQHLDRALELVDPDFGGLRADLVATVVEVLLAEGRAAEALAWLHERLLRDGRLDPRAQSSDLVLVLRVSAALVQRARDAGDRARVERLLADVEGWRERFRVVLTPDVATEEAPGAVEELQVAAETARCRMDADELDRWTALVDHCRRAGLAWEEAGALLRWCETAVRGHPSHDALAAHLRRLHRLATRMGAEPLQRQTWFVADSARVDLTEPLAVPAQATGADQRGRLAGLTGREREILGHLLAGRTNTEIARELVISDKTVSVHVSNILRKTGTTNRAEAAALAHRLM